MTSWPKGTARSGCCTARVYSRGPERPRRCAPDHGPARGSPPRPRPRPEPSPTAPLHRTRTIPGLRDLLPQARPVDAQGERGRLAHPSRSGWPGRISTRGATVSDANGDSEDDRAGRIAGLDDRRVRAVPTRRPEGRMPSQESRCRAREEARREWRRHPAAVTEDAHVGRRPGAVSEKVIRSRSRRPSPFGREHGRRVTVTRPSVRLTVERDELPSSSARRGPPGERRRCSSRPEAPAAVDDHAWCARLRPHAVDERRDDAADRVRHLDRQVHRRRSAGRTRWTCPPGRRRSG